MVAFAAVDYHRVVRIGAVGRPTTPWPAVAGLTVLATLGLSLWLLLGSARGPEPPFLSEAGPSRHRRGGTEDALVLAGSGSNLPVTRALAAAHASHGAPPPVVHASIGSGGGVRALVDGAVDIALVSRPLTAKERDQEVVAVPYARVPVMVAVHSSVPKTDIERGEVLAIFEGTRTEWSDGSPIVVLQRERGDSSHAAMARVMPEFAEVDERAYVARRWRVIYDDVGMQDAIASTEGSIGLVGSGSLPEDLPIRVLSFRGVVPTPEAVVDGSYPIYKDLSFVTLGPPDARAADFFRFVFAPQGRDVIRDHGCMPLGDPSTIAGSP